MGEILRIGKVDARGGSKGEGRAQNWGRGRMLFDFFLVLEIIMRIRR